MQISPEAAGAEIARAAIFHEEPEHIREKAQVLFLARKKAPPDFCEP